MKLTLRGRSLEDPAGLFNASLKAAAIDAQATLDLDTFVELVRERSRTAEERYLHSNICSNIMSVIMDLDTVTTPTDLIALVRDTSAELRARETDLMLLAAAWADAHPDLDAEPEPCDPHEDLDPDEPDPRVPAVAWDAGARSRPRSG